MSSNREETYFGSDGIEWYSESGGPVWPERIRKDRDRDVEDILKTLARLARETDPAGGETTAVEKDLKAQHALRSAGNLVQLVAGWAINHQAGLVKDGLTSVAWVPEVLRPKFSEKISSVDQHEHERRGGHPDYQLKDIEARQLLLNLLELNPGAFPMALQGEVVAELFRINFGEPSPMFQVAKSGSKRSLTSVGFQAQSASMVAYRMEMGATWEEATQTVADSFGADFNTIKGWEAKAKRKFGKLEIELIKNHARNTARNELKEREDKLANKPLARPGYYAAQYDDAALAALVKAYKESLRD
jgi:hypothetical protein